MLSLSFDTAAWSPVTEGLPADVFHLISSDSDSDQRFDDFFLQTPESLAACLQTQDPNGAGVDPTTRPYDANVPSTRPYDANVPTTRPYDANVPTTRPYDANVPSTRPYDANVPSTRPYDANVLSTRPYDANASTTRPYDANVPTTRPYDANVPTTRPYDANASTTRPYDANASTIRPYDADAPTTRCYDADAPTTRPYDADAPTTRCYDADAPSTRPYDADAPTTRPYVADAPSTRPYDADAPSTRPYDADAPSTRPYDADAPSTRPYDADAPSTRPYDADAPTTRPYDADVPTTRPYDADAPSTRPYDADVPTTRPYDTPTAVSSGAHLPRQFISADSLSALTALTERYQYKVNCTGDSAASSSTHSDAVRASPEAFFSEPPGHALPTVLPNMKRRSRLQLSDVGCMTSRSCTVCGQGAHGWYFGALVCLPCKSFFIRCTLRTGILLRRPTSCEGNCDFPSAGCSSCAFCRFQKCLSVGMHRTERPSVVIPAEDQVLCRVCGDISNGVHFGVASCEGCKKFFRRSLTDHQTFVCLLSQECPINPRTRIHCRLCRFQKCLDVGMSHGEKPTVVIPAEDQVLCRVCGDISNGVHFGVASCVGCKKFFRRSLTDHQTFVCLLSQECPINPRTRIHCRLCRFQKCLDVGMSHGAIRLDRYKKTVRPGRHSQKMNRKQHHKRGKSHRSKDDRRQSDAAPTMTNTLTSPTVTNTLTSPSVTNTLTSPTVTNTLTSPTVTNTLTSPTVTNTLTSPTVTNTLTSPTVTNTLTSPTVTNTLTSPTVTNTLTSPTVTNTLTSPTVTNTLTSTTMTNALTSPTVTNTLTSLTVTNTLTSPTVTNTLTSPTVTNTLTSPTVTNTLTSPIMTNTLTSPIMTNTLTPPIMTNMLETVNDDIDNAATEQTTELTQMDNMDELPDELLDALAREVASELSKNISELFLTTDPYAQINASGIGTMDAPETSLLSGEFLTPPGPSISSAFSYLSCSPLSGENHLIQASCGKASPSVLSSSQTAISSQEQACSRGMEGCAKKSNKGNGENTVTEVVKTANFHTNKTLHDLSSFGLSTPSHEGIHRPLDHGPGEVATQYQKNRCSSNMQSMPISCRLTPYQRNRDDQNRQEEQRTFAHKVSVEESHCPLPETTNVCIQTSALKERFRPDVASCMHVSHHGPVPIPSPQDSQKLSVGDGHDNITSKRFTANRSGRHRVGNCFSSEVKQKTLPDLEVVPKHSVSIGPKRQRHGYENQAGNHYHRHVEKAINEIEGNISMQHVYNLENSSEKSELGDTHTDSTPVHRQHSLSSRSEPVHGQLGLLGLEECRCKGQKRRARDLLFIHSSSESLETARVPHLSQSGWQLPTDQQTDALCSASVFSAMAGQRGFTVTSAADHGQNPPAACDVSETCFGKQRETHCPEDCHGTRTQTPISVKWDSGNRNNIPSYLSSGNILNKDGVDETLSRQTQPETRGESRATLTPTQASTGAPKQPDDHSDSGYGPCSPHPTASALADCFHPNDSCPMTDVASPDIPQHYSRASEHAHMSESCSPLRMQSHGRIYQRFSTKEQAPLTTDCNPSQAQSCHCCSQTFFCRDSEVPDETKPSGMHETCFQNNCSWGFEGQTCSCPSQGTVCSGQSCSQLTQTKEKSFHSDIEHDARSQGFRQGQMRADKHPPVTDNQLSSHKQTTSSFCLSKAGTSQSEQSALPDNLRICVDADALEKISHRFLNIDNTCEHHGCNDETTRGCNDRDRQTDFNTCSNSDCQTCSPSRSKRRAGVNARLWCGQVCPRRHHRYWHTVSASEADVSSDRHRDHVLTSVVTSAFCQFTDRVHQLHEKYRGVTEDRKQDAAQTMLAMLYCQDSAIATATKQFMLNIAGNLSNEDASRLSARSAFDSLLIVLGWRHYDTKTHRFRQLWTRPAVAVTCFPLWSFQVRLWAAAAQVNGLALDQTEAALLCALAVFSTDIMGLQDGKAVQETRCSLLHCLQTYISARDQWCNVRVRRVFSVMPDVRLLSAWYSAILLSITP